jgi:hypothetical protein
MKSCCIVENVNGYEINAKAVLSGTDLIVIVNGGTKPHIGSISVAVARESLLKNGSMSATVSTFNVLGHKDDEIGNMFAREIAMVTGSTCVVTCGIHIDCINKDEIDSVVAASQKLLGRMKEVLQKMDMDT